MSQNNPTRRPPKKFSLVLWWLQLLSAACSLVFFAGLVALPYFYGYRQLSKWPSRVFSFNSAIGAMSTGIKVTMMLAVADSTSQCKWNWFTNRRSVSRQQTSDNGRRLKDLESFDGALRGVYGSILLVGKSRMNLVTLGALVTICSLAFETFS